MGIEMLACLARLQLALLPIERPGGVTDGDWEEVIRRLPEVMATSLNLLPSEYQGRALEAVRDRLTEYP